MKNVNLFYVDITLYNPAIYYLINIQDHLLHFYKLNINKEDIKYIQSICNNHFESSKPSSHLKPELINLLTNLLKRLHQYLFIVI